MCVCVCVLVGKAGDVVLKRVEVSILQMLTGSSIESNHPARVNIHTQADTHTHTHPYASLLSGCISSTHVLSWSPQKR